MNDNDCKIYLKALEKQAIKLCKVIDSNIPEDQRELFIMYFGLVFQRIWRDYKDENKNE